MSGFNDKVVGEKFVVPDHVIEWAAYDRLPKYVRDALIAAKYEYSAIQLWQTFPQVKQDMQLDSPFGVIHDRDVWNTIVSWIRLNDQDAAKQERQMYLNLVVEFREQRNKRIEEAFLKNSKPA